MKKRKGVLLTLALAGAITLCGAGGLYVSMAKNMQEDTTIQVEQKRDEVFEAAVQEEDALVQGAEQVWQEKEGIYLPDGAKVIETGEDGYEIEWDGCVIKYWQDDKYFEKETREDLGLGNLMPILKDTMKKYSGQEPKECEMEVYLVAAEEVEEEAKPDDKCVHMTEEEVAALEPAEDTEIREYDIATKHYQVGVMFDNYDYNIWVDSVTGEVLGYYYSNNNLGEYTHGWEKKLEYGPEELDFTKEEQKEYDDMIASFVSDELKLGKVEKVFAQYWGLAHIMNGSEGDVRAYYTALCKTEDGTITEVSFDMGEKRVNSFDTTVVYSSED